MENLIVSASPHCHGSASTQKIMLDVIIALMPACVAAVVIFGPVSLAIIILSTLAAVLSEYVSRRIMKRSNTVGDLSAAVTGILVAMNMPATVHALWMAPLGSVIAIVVIKQLFGGLGMNFVNPAIAGRIAVMMSFTGMMSMWPTPFYWLGNTAADAATCPTPLSDTTISLNAVDMLFGVRGGCLGETCAVALIAGGIYLVLRKVITPLIPTVFVGTTVLMMWAFGADPIQQLLSGGLLLGAIFMATDYVTTPSTKRGQVVFAVGCGLITAVIRRFGSMTEGVSFAIILMNILVPHIDNIFTRRPFGARKEGAKQ